MTDRLKEPDRPGGLTLDEAWKTYVSRELRVRFLVTKSLCPPPWDDDRIELMERDESYLDSPRAAAFVAFNNAWRAVWGDLVARLVSGDLVGFVFDEAPGLDGVRRRVSADRWQHAVYKGSHVEIYGVLYIDARIWRAVDLEEPVDKPDAAGGRVNVVARQKMDLKVLVGQVARETPAASAILAGHVPPRGGIRDAVWEMMADSRLAGANMESVEKEFRNLRAVKAD